MKRENNWIITATKLELDQIRLNWIEFGIMLDLPFDQSNNQSFICLYINESQIMELSIWLSLNQIGCVWFLIVVVISNINRSFTFRYLNGMLYSSILTKHPINGSWIADSKCIWMLNIVQSHFSFILIIVIRTKRLLNRLIGWMNGDYLVSFNHPHYSSALYAFWIPYDFSFIIDYE